MPLSLLYIKLLKYLLEITLTVSFISLAIFLAKYFFTHNSSIKEEAKKGLLYAVLAAIASGSFLLLINSVVSAGMVRM